MKIENIFTQDQELKDLLKNLKKMTTKMIFYIELLENSQNFTKAKDFRLKTIEFGKAAKKFRKLSVLAGLQAD